MGITKKEIQELLAIRQEKTRLEKLDKEITAKLLSKAGNKLSEEWKDISYTITEGKTTYANREKIKTLPNWQEYFNTTTFPKINIKPCAKYCYTKEK